MHDRDPPHAAAASLPKLEAQFDPAVLGAKAERSGRAASADAGDAHLTATSAAIVAARLGGARGKSEQEQREGHETSHEPQCAVSPQ